VESGLHGYMASDSLEVWLRQSNGVESPTSVPHDPSGGRYLPERLHATGKITLSTEQIQARVADLKLNIHYAGPASAAPPPSSAGAGTAPAAGTPASATPASATPASAAASAPAAAPELALSDSAGRPMYQWVQPPAGPPVSDATAPAAADSAPTAPQSEPIHISGSSLQSSLIVAEKQSWVDNLTLAGPLLVSGQAPQPHMPGWEITGDQLQLATTPAGQVDLQVSGQPARIALAEGSLAGPTIRFDQKSNLIWMDQPGEFTLPTSVLARPNGSPNKSEAMQVDWFQPPHCTWQGHMLFDGRMVQIEGDIDFDGAARVFQNDQWQNWWVSGQCQALALELAEAIDLDSPNEGNPQPYQVTLSNQVNILASQLDQAGSKRSREQLQLPSLTFNIPGNEIIGLGPGSIRSWHLSTMGLGQMASSRAQASENLQGAHLVFRESMHAFLDRSEIYFQGKVELAAGPLATWEDAIDLAHMQQLSLDQMLLDCDLLKVYDTSGLSSTSSLSGGGSRGNTPKSWEFQAKGNVNFEGRAASGLYEGNGTQVDYVQAKELLMLWGEPQRPASIKKVPSNPQDATVEASIVRAAINPRTLAIEHFEVGQNGIGMQMGGPAVHGGPPPGLAPAGPLPNPRGSVNNFFHRQSP
ncbi:MAG: hypothetical protein KDA45_13975, partial [Planctomycetales bacterium]|nr:hypothetical protein [Planctomycetales bacterium]